MVTVTSYEWIETERAVLSKGHPKVDALQEWLWETGPRQQSLMWQKWEIMIREIILRKSQQRQSATHLYQ